MGRTDEEWLRSASAGGLTRKWHWGTFWGFPGFRDGR